VPGIELGGIQVTGWREGGTLHVDVQLEDADGTAWELDAGYLNICITVAGGVVHQDSHELPDACTECGASTADGEGYAGKCGNCADRADAARKARDRASGRPGEAGLEDDRRLIRKYNDEDEAGEVALARAGSVLPPGPETGIFTAAQVSAAHGKAAGMIRDLLNPGHVENGDTLADAALVDLAGALAAHLLSNPTATRDAAIAACYPDIVPDFDDLGQHWNQHNNDIGDWCPHSGKPVPPDYDDGTDDPLCPATCRASRAQDDDEPAPGTDAWNAALVATVSNLLINLLA
jgi:hypothetical protein